MKGATLKKATKKYNKNNVLNYLTFDLKFEGIHNFRPWAAYLPNLTFIGNVADAKLRAHAHTHKHMYKTLS